MLDAKRLLMITPDVTFAINAQKALERNGSFTVTKFASGIAGVDYLRKHPQDVAFVDFRTKDMPGTDIIDHLRTLQPKIAIVAAPEHPRIRELMDKYNIQDIAPIPITTRKFIAMLNDAIQIMAQSKRRVPQSPQDRLYVGRTAQALEFWLSDTEDGDTIIEFKAPTQPTPAVPPESSATFQKLAADEPPLPDVASGGTLSDLRQQLTSINDLKRVIAQANDDNAATVGDVEEDTQPSDDPATIPAAFILDTLDTLQNGSTSIEIFTMDGFKQKLAERNAEGIDALPSWQEEAERYVKPPTFLPPEMQFPELEEAIEYTGTVTIANMLIESDPGDLVTDPIEPIRRSSPRDTASRPTDQPERPSSLPEIETTDKDDASLATTASQYGAPPPPSTLPDLAVSNDTQPSTQFVTFAEDDPAIAQLATELTQMSLESRADATVLARNSKIVAYAGKIPQEMIEPLYDQLTREWNIAEETNKSRVVFALVPETGEDYMISTTSTDVGFTLSLIFAGTRSWQDIRRQSQRIVDALEAMPEPELPQISQPFQPIIDESIARTPIAYLWLLDDPTISLDSTLQRPIRKSLQKTLYDAGWIIDDLAIEDYIYLYGQMPTSLSARDTLTTLMQTAAEAIGQDADTVWDDSYLILQPGRPMQTTDIQRFINFARR